MQICSKTSELAVLALCHVAKNDEGGKKFVPADEIIKVTGSGDFTRKVLQRLAQHSFLESMKGPTGGFRLGQPASEISVRAVIEMFDGEERPHGLDQYPRWRAMTWAAEDRLAKLTLAALVR